MWNIEFSDEFGDWWETLDHSRQDAIEVGIILLRELGPRADTIFQRHLDQIRE